MTFKTLLAAVAVMTTLSAPALAASTADPYAAITAKAQAQNRQTTLDTLFSVYHAVGCEVLEEWRISPIAERMIKDVGNAELTGDAQREFSFKAYATMREAKKLAAKSGCHYWHSHPEAVMIMRLFQSR